MKLKRLIIIAPNDRYNYGDLLFSHIIKFQIGNLYDEIINVATVEANLTKVGGDKVQPLSVIYSLSDEFENQIIVAGGESLFSQWYHTISYLNPDFRRKVSLIVKVLNKLDLQELYFRLARNYAKISFKATTQFPYTIGKREVRNVSRIFYNSLGASALKNSFLKKKSTREILHNVDYISLRDRNSNEILTNEGFKSFLAPDCAVIMSEYYKSDFLKQNANTDTLKYAEEHYNKYVVFQINRKLGEKHINEICGLLTNLNDKKNIKICLCPVGFALGHEDQIILKEIYRKLTTVGVYPFFLEDLKIWDIMVLIKNCKLYIGTSLHGAITAMSYKRPYIGILTRKTIEYIKTWGVKEKVTTAVDLDLLPKISTLFNDETLEEELKKNYLFQHEEVIKSFNRMKEHI